MVSSAYLRFLLFLPTVLIPACNSSSQAFCMMCFVYKLNKQGDSIQPCHTPFPILNQFIVPCPVVPVVSWPAYRFLRRQETWSDIPISFIIFQFVVIHVVKDLSIVNDAEVDFFSGIPLLSHDPMNVGSLISSSFAFSQPEPSTSGGFIFRSRSHFVLTFT